MISVQHYNMNKLETYGLRRHINKVLMSYVLETDPTVAMGD